MSDLSAVGCNLSSLDLITVDVPQKSVFRSAIGLRRSRRALLLKWTDTEGRFGYSECSCRPDPYFSHEYLDGVRQVIAEHLFPVLEKDMRFADLEAALARIRGWQFAKATVTATVFDLWRRQGIADPLDHWREDERLYEIPVGISLGIFDTAQKAITEIEKNLAAGYRRIKLKIRPGLPTDYLAQIRQAFPEENLGVDANGSFTEREMSELVAIARLGLAMIEQPFAPDRLDLCAALRQRADVRVCLDESIAAPGHLISAIRMGAIDELNIKPGRVGGMQEARALAEVCREHGIPAWVGGMFETGVGRAANLRFAACFPNARAHDLSPSSRYFKRDLVTFPIQMSDRGTVTRPDLPVTLDEDAVAAFRVDHLRLEK